MALTLDDKLVVGISSRALFDLEEEHALFQKEGLGAYSDYQIAHENDILKPGTAFPLIKALHRLNADGRYLAEIIVMSQNSADTSLRIFNSIEHYGLNISRAALVSGSSIAPYLTAFRTDLFLSANEEDVQEAVNGGVASGIICSHVGLPMNPEEEIPQIRIAFDGDAVLFSSDSERIFQKGGLQAFSDYEAQKADIPMEEGPFAKFLKTIAHIQAKFDDQSSSPIRTALVTSRGAPAHERAIKTLRQWGVRVDEAFFLGGVSKRDVLSAFGAHIFFDDQMVHAEYAAPLVPSAVVPYRTGEDPMVK